MLNYVKKVDLGWTKLVQCGREVRINLPQVVTGSLPVPVCVPGNGSEVTKVVEAGRIGNVNTRPLNSIVGHWLASANNLAQQQFAPSLTFQTNNQILALLTSTELCLHLYLVNISFLQFRKNLVFSQTEDQ
jgi:hypothetical protein